MPLKLNINLAILAVFIGIFLSLPFSAKADLRSACASLLKKAPRAEDVIPPLLTYGRAQHILSVLRKEDSRSRQSDRAGAQFEVYLEARMAYLTESQQATVRSILSSRLTVVSLPNVKQPSGQLPRANYDYEKKSINIEINELYRYSAMYFFALVHELEHAIQALHPFKGRTLLTPEAYFFQDLFNKEKGALTAEGIYLMSIPKEELARLGDQILGNQQIALRTRLFYSSVIQSAFTAVTVSDYVESQWEIGRYSTKQLTKFKTDVVSSYKSTMFSSGWRIAIWYAVIHYIFN